MTEALFSEMDAAIRRCALKATMGLGEVECEDLEAEMWQRVERALPRFDPSHGITLNQYLLQSIYFQRADWWRKYRRRITNGAYTNGNGDERGVRKFAVKKMKRDSGRETPHVGAIEKFCVWDGQPWFVHWG